MIKISFFLVFLYALCVSALCGFVKLYALLLNFVLLYKLVVLLFVLVFFVFYINLKKKFLINYFFANKISANFVFNIKIIKKINFFSNSFINFFLIVYSSIFVIALLIYFFMFNNYDGHLLLSFSNWAIYSCQLLSINFDWLIYLDFISFYFIILTTFIFFLVFLNLFSLKFKKDYSKNYFNFKLLLFLLLSIEFFLVLTFSTSSIFFFFFFFEVSLLPLYILVQVWGRGLKKKQYAMFSLLFFTLSGSIFLLCGILVMFNSLGTVDFRVLTFEKISFNTQVLLFSLFFLGFAFKAPVFPFYSWLPEAHVEASTSVSILLAAIFLKIASYGFLRVIVFNLGEASFYFHSLIITFCATSIFVVFFLALTQTDLKKIIALSSIGHMNYILIGLFTYDAKAVLGALVYMGAHALISSALFMLIGAIYETSNSRDLLNFSNIKNYDGKWSFFFFLFNLANISFPGFISFFCELIIFTNSSFFSLLSAILIIFALFFSTIYTFWIMHNVLYGRVVKKNFFLLSKNDIFSLNFLFLLVFLFGVFPFILLKNFEQNIYVLLIKNMYNV